MIRAFTCFSSFCGPCSLSRHMSARPLGCCTKLPGIDIGIPS
ncbi:hypothetical protein HanIR_Chr14g0685241 [Helianthus annuus]|nr:hypothetical protein HanIR_Chr14g0685241 [Helianthus annuus]